MTETTVAAADTSEPRYTHDHDTCTYLGQHNNDSQTADLYYCDQGGTNPTVIARYSNDAPNYQSGLLLADHIPALAAARTLAQVAGLIP